MDEKTKQILQNDIEKNYKVRESVGSSIMPVLVETIAQYRNVVLHYALIAGAIAAFTIPVLGSKVIYLKFFAYLALVYLFAIIVYALFHVGILITKEINGLKRQLYTYLKVIDESIKVRRKAIETSNIGEMQNFDRPSALKQLSELTIPDRPDNSLAILSRLIFLALFSLLLSVVPAFEIIKTELQSLF
ncbi:MAG: hypothetical protein WC988_01430 [Patescibacteria group bacterium]